MINFVTFRVLLTLTDGKTHSAKALARENEVSTKTIIRCVDNLTLAGLFVSSVRGKNGGFFIEKNSIPDLSLVSQDELDELAIICSIKQSTFGNSEALSNLIEKIKNTNPKNSFLSMANKIIFDTIPWGKIKTDTSKTNTLARAIKTSTLVKIDYGSGKKRTLAPYCLTLKSGSWYLYAKEDNTFKLFKVSRIQEIVQTQKRFITDSSINLSDKPWNNFDSINKIIVTLETNKSYLPEASEWLDIISCHPSKTPEKIIIKAKCPGNLSFLYKLIEEERFVRLISPKSEIEKLIALLRKVQTKYAV